MGAASTPSPTAAGVAISATSRSAQSRVSENAADDAAACWRDRCGRMTVASAIPSTPRGNSTIRSEKYSQDTLPVTRNDAITVSTSRLIWETETPNTAGRISEITRATPSWARRRRGRTSIPSAARKGSWNASWTMPAASTPHASATTGTSSTGASQSAAPMRQTLSSTGVKAGIANRP